jgi:hypothetical protein
MPRKDERQTEGLIEDRKLFSMRDIKKIIIYIFTGLATAFATIQGYSYFNGADPIRNETQIERGINNLEKFEVKAQGHIDNPDIHMSLKNMEDHFVTRREYMALKESIEKLNISVNKLSDKIEQIK